MDARQDNYAEELLHQGIVEAKAGHHSEAQKLLKQATQLDAENAMAWLWLSGVSKNPLEQESSLEKVLQLDPHNVPARKGLPVARERAIKVLLDAGIKAAQADDRARASELLSQVVQRDEDQLDAWVWLSRVVDKSEDRLVCFENIISLDPENDEAQRNLELLQRSMSAPGFASDYGFSDAEGTRDDAIFEDSPAAAMEKDMDLEVLSPVQHLWDKFEDELLCPYCAQPTGSEDSRCAACGESLWLVMRERDSLSGWWWVILGLKILGSLALGLGLFVVMAVGMQPGGYPAFLQEKFFVYFPLYAYLEPQILQYLGLLLLFFVVYFLFNLGSTLAWGLRWAPVYYLELCMAGFWVLLHLGSMLYSLVSFSIGGVISGLLPGIVSTLYFLIIFSLRGNFSKEKIRVLLNLDADASDGATYLDKGRFYASCNMWALSMIHLRRAASLMHAQVDPYLALATACAHLRERELAEFYIGEARNIDPQDEHIVRVEKMLAKRMAAAA